LAASFIPRNKGKSQEIKGSVHKFPASASLKTGSSTGFNVQVSRLTDERRNNLKLFLNLTFKGKTCITRLKYERQTRDRAEKMGFIKPKRGPRTNNRIYSDFEIEQIRQISRLIHNEGFTLPCIQRLLQLAPCWNIFDCVVKEKCPAYEFAPAPCYETRKKRETLCSGACEQCAVYINRSSKKEKILEGPR